MKNVSSKLLAFILLCTAHMTQATTKTEQEIKDELNKIKKERITELDKLLKKARTTLTADEAAKKQQKVADEKYQKACNELKRVATLKTLSSEQKEETKALIEALEKAQKSVQAAETAEEANKAANQDFKLLITQYRNETLTEQAKSAPSRAKWATIGAAAGTCVAFGLHKLGIITINVAKSVAIEFSSNKKD